MGLLSGKTAIISGGSDGIGRAIAACFVAEGAKTWICGRTQDKLDTAVKDIGGDICAQALDVGDAESYVDFIKTVAAKDGLDVLINNAPYVGYGMLADTALDEFQTNFRINVDAAYAAMQASFSAMADKGGSIINLSSINGKRAMQGMSGYSAAKAALLHLTRAAAMEGARANIRVNTITPGPIMTPGTRAYFQSDPEAGAKIEAANPMGRIGEPEEVAQVALFLASDMASYVTGADIPVDGGKANELYVPA